MSWILIAYLIALALLTFKVDSPVSGKALAKAWSWIAAIGICHFIFSVLRAGNYRNAKDLMLIGIWEDGFGWLLLGISILCLARGIAEKRSV